MQTIRLVPPLFLFTIILTGLVTKTAQADSRLEARYRTTAKQIVEALRSKNIKTTGVLKFSVRIGLWSLPGKRGLAEYAPC